MATHSSTLAWKIPWTEEPGRLHSVHGVARVGHNWATSFSLFTFMHWRRKWQPTPLFLPGESQGRGSLVGCRLWDRTVGHDCSDLAAAAAFNSYFFTLCNVSLCFLLHLPQFRSSLFLFVCCKNLSLFYPSPVLLLYSSRSITVSFLKCAMLKTLQWLPIECT